MNKLSGRGKSEENKGLERAKRPGGGGEGRRGRGTIVPSTLHSTLTTRGIIWNMKRFPNPVWRSPKAFFLFSTVRKQRFCSSFTSEVWMKSRRESLNAVFEELIRIVRVKIAFGHDMEIRRQNGFVNQTCQQLMIWPIGDCTRIYMHSGFYRGQTRKIRKVLER